MEITESSLRRRVREVDELHRDGLSTIRQDIEAVHVGAAERVWGSSRRRFLQGAAGLATALGASAVGLAAFAGQASAAGGMTDQDLARFAESLELAIVAVYAIALQKGTVKTPAGMSMLTTFSGHHADHAKALGAFAGDADTAKPNPGVLSASGDQMREAPDEMHVMQAAFDTENAAAATYLFAIGALNNTQAQAAVASILPVEAQHAAAIGLVLGKDPSTDADMLPPFQTLNAAISPSMFPVAGS